MKTAIKYLSLLGLALSNNVIASNVINTPVVETISGPIIGLKDKTMNAYMGIPYAKPPTGKLRWMPPQSLQSWNEPLKTQKYASQCPQNADLGQFAEAGGNEDCLYLNVFTPSHIKTKHPVIVWIHGGGLAVGSSNVYNPNRLVNEGNAVVVTLNYRLGILGFLSYPALDNEKSDSVNYGLMDQSKALSWVKHNIQHFGGDPENITIMGESSGGTSVMAQVVSPKSKGLFQHAFALSGSSVYLKTPAFGAPLSIEQAQKKGIEFVKSTGCTDKECLRQLSVKTLLQHQTKYLLNEGVTETSFLPESFQTAINEGHFNKVTLVSGNMRDEGQFFTALMEKLSGITIDEQNYSLALEDHYGKSLAKKVESIYPTAKYNTPSDAFSAAFTDSLFACANLKISEYTAKYVPTYMYQFSDRTAPSYVSPATFNLGAAHTLELPYLFPGFKGAAGTETKLNEFQNVLAKKYVHYVSQVADLALGKDEWQPYQPGEENIMTFVLPKAHMVTGQYSQQHQCEFWDSTGIY